MTSRNGPCSLCTHTVLDTAIHGYKAEHIWHLECGRILNAIDRETTQGPVTTRELLIQLGGTAQVRAVLRGAVRTGMVRRVRGVWSAL